MTPMVPRRAALLGAGAMLLCRSRPARALDGADAAALLAPDDPDAKAAVQRRPGSAAVAAWGAPADRLWAACLAEEDHTMLVGVLQEADTGAARVVAGPLETEALCIDPFWTLDLAVSADTLLGAGQPAFAVHVSNSYLSTGRSTSTDAIHLFLRRGDTILPVFGTYLAASHSYDVPCRPRRRSEQPCRRAWERRWAVEAGRPARPGEPPPLIVRALPSQRIVSRHRWHGDRYDPARFEDLPPLGPG